MPTTELPVIEMTVGGMSCAHCERAVREAIAARDASAVVELDLATGRLRARTRLDREALAAAIREAGYTT